MNLDTSEVLEAAGTKWNFLPFKPGLVGGHCIGVDPYYLTYKAKKLGYNSKIILSGRKLNDSVPKNIFNNIISYFKKKKKKLSSIKVLILGITFKENCSDVRNSMVINIYKKLHKEIPSIDIYDPFAIKKDIKEVYNIDLLNFNQLKDNYYDCVLIAVGHKQFLNLNVEEYISNNNSLIYDVKGIYKNMNYMRL